MILETSNFKELLQHLLRQVNFLELLRQKKASTATTMILERSSSKELPQHLLRKPHPLVMGRRKKGWTATMMILERSSSKVLSQRLLRNPRPLWLWKKRKSWATRTMISERSSPKMLPQRVPKAHFLVLPQRALRKELYLVTRKPLPRVAVQSCKWMRACAASGRSSRWHCDIEVRSQRRQRCHLCRTCFRI